MKVVHLSTSDSGGAATAALRLHAGLLSAGVDSAFLSRHVSDRSGIARFRYPTPTAGIGTRILRKAGVLAGREQRNKQILRRFGGEFEAFTFPLTDCRVEKHPLLAEADIVHLHWISNFVNYTSFFTRIGKPLVWTLHDMNPILGGFHYPGDQERNSRMAGLDDSLRATKQAVISRVRQLTLVTPSEWLGAHVAGSPAFAGFDRAHIPYGLDLRIFKPHDRAFSRSVFDIPVDKKVILFVSERVNNYRKGFDLLKAALDKADLHDDVTLVTIGAGAPSKDDPSQISLGMIRDERVLALLYSAADVFILPSREDNLPNVMLESLACGTPVISFANGGMREVIGNGLTGILVQDISPNGLSKAIRAFVNEELCFDRKAIRRFSEQKFSLATQAERYLELYRTLISR